MVAKFPCHQLRENKEIESMLTALRLFLLAGFILTAISSWGEDSLPRLPTSGSSSSTIDQNLSVTCYLGNPNDGNTMGGVMVNNPTAAGPTCNSLNYACQGRCYGCYSDFDLSEDVCVDAAGRRFIR